MLKTNCNRFIACLMMIWILPVFSADMSLTSAGRLTAKSLLVLPTTMAVKIVATGSEEISPDLLDLVESLLDEQGITVSERGGYTYYLQRIEQVSKKGKESRASFALDGGNRRLTNVQVEVEASARKKVKGKALPLTYGFEGKLEGPGGVTYWQVKATATRQAEVERVSDPLLLRRSTSVFGQTVDEIISVN